MVDVSEEIAQGGNLSMEQFAKIITWINKQKKPLQDDRPPDWRVKTTQIDLHDQSYDVITPTDDNEAIDHATPTPIVRRIPDIVRAYDLTEDYSHASGLTFPNAMAESLKFGAGCKTDGASYIIIDDNDWFDVNDLVIACWLKLPATQSGDSNQWIVHKGTGTAFFLHLHPYSEGANKLGATVYVGGVGKSVSYTYTPDTWFCVIVHADSSNITMWIDNVQKDQTATGGVADTNATNVGIFANASGTGNLRAGSMIALLTIGDKDIITDSAWRSDFQNGEIDWQDATGEEITTFPFLASYKSEPVSHAGFFWGG